MCVIFDVKWLSYHVRNFNATNAILIALSEPSTSSFKSIEGYAGEISLHQFTCHFNLIHFLGRYLESLSKMIGFRLEGHRLPIFMRIKSARVQKICYDSGRKLKGLTGVAWPRSDQPQTGVDQLGEHIRRSFVERFSPGEVIIH